MDKTDALLCVERIREALRALPDDMDTFGWATGYDNDRGAVVTELHLTKAVEWPAVFDGKRYDGWQEKRIAITPWVYGWWADRSVNDDGTDS